MQTILVIDDDESLRDTIGLMLENEGFRPVLVGDGAAGLEQAFSAKPHLILVDLRMPGLSGVDVCKRLRAAGAKTPVIVLSALGDEIDKVLMLEIGADDYVVKPFGTRELLAGFAPCCGEPRRNPAPRFPSPMWKWIWTKE
jgi:DNA-binding response OmpR family regulator